MLIWLRKEEHYKTKKIIITYNMGKEIIAFGNIEVDKHKFHQHETPISIYDLNSDRIVESNKVFG